MNYKIIRNALSLEECQNLIKFGEDQYVYLNPDQIYPNRYYPGFTLRNTETIQHRLAEFVADSGLDVVYDFGLGTAVNFINAEPGDSLGMHIDKPLYEFDENLQVLPEYDNRMCSLSILAGLSGSNELGIEEDIITLNETDVIIMRGFTVHELKPVMDKFYMLSAFYCANIN